MRQEQVGSSQIHPVGDPPRPPRPLTAGRDLPAALLARVRNGSPQRHCPAGLADATTDPHHHAGRETSGDAACEARDRRQQ